MFVLHSMHGAEKWCGKKRDRKKKVSKYFMVNMTGKEETEKERHKPEFGFMQSTKRNYLHSSQHIDENVRYLI